MKCSSYFIFLFFHFHCTLFVSTRVCLTSEFNFYVYTFAHTLVYLITHSFLCVYHSNLGQCFSYSVCMSYKPNHLKLNVLNVFESCFYTPRLISLTIWIPFKSLAVNLRYTYVATMLMTCKFEIIVHIALEIKCVMDNYTKYAYKKLHHVLYSGNVWWD